MTNNIPKVKVFQFDKQLNFIKEYESIVSTAKQLNIGKDGITATCLINKNYLEDIYLDI